MWNIHFVKYKFYNNKNEYLDYIFESIYLVTGIEKKQAQFLFENIKLNEDLTLQYALDLTMFAKSKGLQGVMTWDANIDSTGVDGNAPYAYSLGIQATLGNGEGGEGYLKDAVENRNIFTFFYRLFWN